MKKHIWFLIALMITAGAVTGCNKTTSIGTANKIFESADAETKTLWQNAMSASQTNDYAASITMLKTLIAKPSLNPKQFQAAEDTLTAITQKMMDAANKGDAEAQKAMDELSQVNRQMRGR